MPRSLKSTVPSLKKKVSRYGADFFGFLGTANSPESGRDEADRVQDRIKDGLVLGPLGLGAQTGKDNDFVVAQSGDEIGS